MTEPTKADIRAWARAQGMVVAERGRLPESVVRAYADAHQAQEPAAAPRKRAAKAAGTAAATPAKAAPRGSRTVPPTSASPAAPARKAPGTKAVGGKAAGAKAAPRKAAARSANPRTAPVAMPTGPAPVDPVTDELPVVEQDAVEPGAVAHGPAASPFAVPPGPATPYEPPPSDGSYGPPPQQEQGTDGFAIASLVFGLLGGVLLSLVFGVLALRRIRRSGRRGRGLAIAGLVLSALWAVGVAVAVAVALAGEADRDEGGAVTARGTVPIEELRVGDCVDELPEGLVDSVEVVPCDQPHVAGTYALFDLPGQEYPGDEAVDRDSEQRCSEELEDLLPADDTTPYELVFYTPTAETWELDDRTVICLATAPGGRPTTGSVLPE